MVLQEPIEVSGLEKEVVQISTGYYHSAAITGERTSDVQSN